MLFFLDRRSPNNPVIVCRLSVVKEEFCFWSMKSKLRGLQITLSLASRFLKFVATRLTAVGNCRILNSLFSSQSHCRNQRQTEQTDENQRRRRQPTASQQGNGREDDGSQNIGVDEKSADITIGIPTVPAHNIQFNNIEHRTSLLRLIANHHKAERREKRYTMTTSTFLIALMMCAGLVVQPSLAFTSSSPTFSVSKPRLGPLKAVELLSALDGSQSLATADIANSVGGLTGFSAAVNSFFQTDPYLASFLTCSFKASAADMIAQQQEESADEASSSPTSTSKPLSSSDSTTIISDVDLSRNLGFLLYGGLYTGIFQNFLYSIIYPAWFGTEESISVIARQVLADNLIFGPLLCLPVGYAFKTAFTSEDGLTLNTLRDGMEKYKLDILERDLLTKYWSIWMPAQCLTFSVIPHHFRVVFVAAVSFFWFFILSTVSSAQGDENESLESK
jgi:hypothetical protein